MRVVYIDALFLLNLLMDYLALLLTGRITGDPMKRLRLLGGALLGALYAAAVFWPGWAFLQSPLVRLGVGLLMVLAAYGHSRRLLRTYLWFLAVSALLGGAVCALSFLGAGVALVEGVAVPTVDLRLVLLGAACAYGALSLVGRRVGRHSPRELRRVEVSLAGQAAQFTALVDSGNTLTDPVTGKPVMVAEGARLAPLLPPEADFSNPADCFPRLREPQRYRLLSYRTVGVDQGLLLAVRVDRMTVDGEETENRLVALSPTPVSDGGAYQALLYTQ